MPDRDRRPDKFTKQRMLWLDGAFEEAANATAFRVAYALGRWFNRERYAATGLLQAWRSQDELAKDTRMTRRGVQKCLDSLSANGLISIIPGKGRGVRSTYEAVIPSQACGSPSPAEKTNARSPFEKVNTNQRSPFYDEKEEPAFGFCRDKNANDCSKKANSRSKKGEQPFAQKSLNQISDKISERETLSIDADFDRFFAAYPRKVAKSAARKAFAQAIKSGADSSEIITGAVRYAAERRREPDPAKREKYTAHPSTWLNQARWQDEPASAAIAHRGNGHFHLLEDIDRD